MAGKTEDRRALRAKGGWKTKVARRAASFHPLSVSPGSGRIGGLASQGFRAGIRPEPANSVVWPSGQGDEIGTIDADWGTLLRSLRAESATSPFHIGTIRDADLRAFVLRDAGGAPVTLVESDVPGRPGFAVIADRDADVAGVLVEIQRMIGGELRLKPAPHLVSHQT